MNLLIKFSEQTADLKIGLDRAFIVGKLKPMAAILEWPCTWGIQWCHREKNENSDILLKVDERNVLTL